MPRIKALIFVVHTFTRNVQVAVQELVCTYHGSYLILQRTFWFLEIWNSYFEYDMPLNFDFNLTLILYQ